MAGLKDIVVSCEEVSGVTVTGVSAQGIGYLLARYPELAKVMTGQPVTAKQLWDIAPHAIAAIIATGCGVVPDGTDECVKLQKDSEAKAAVLPAGLQMQFLDAIIRLTMPGGVGPFVAAVERITQFAADVSTSAAGTKSQSPSSPSAEAA